MVQWLGLCPSTAGGPGLVPGQGTKTSQAMQVGETKPSKTNKKTEWAPINQIEC